ncbi:Arc family DNA-binding protein [Nitrobacter sp. JJSN]|uniref:Arc family DNA-binding protein n=1 Tax=Nitrobacter sp. JJSN TaxID=3453033 RepID=UPI003F760280
MTKKAAKTTKAGRGSEQFVVRLPPGMRDAIAHEADRNGRSMNAEIVGRLAFSFEEVLSNEGLIAVSKRFAAAAEAMEDLFFDLRDMEIERFIVDQRAKGKNLTRTEAIRLIVRNYLAENGYLHGASVKPTEK